MRTNPGAHFFYPAIKASVLNLANLRSSEYAEAPHFLLVGNPVAHSLSPLMHNTAASHYGMSTRYLALTLDASEPGSFASYLNNKYLKGVNITIPYKQLLMDYVDELDDASRQIKAINTIVKKDSRLVGYNTDAYGFLNPLDQFKDEIKNSRAIIFGTGGASRAIVYALRQCDTEEIILVSRNPQQKKEEKWPGNIRFCSHDAWPSFAKEASLIVNATPLGMIPNEQGSPVQQQEMNYLGGKICYDIVYKPQETLFLKRAAEAGARTIGGLEMLIHQGSRAFELWTGKPFPIKIIRKRLKNHLANVN